MSSIISIKGKDIHGFYLIVHVSHYILLLYIIIIYYYNILLLYILIGRIQLRMTLGIVISIL